MSSQNSSQSSSHNTTPVPPPKLEPSRSACPVACSLDILGDKWTLLVIRDIFMGKKTYSEFQHSPEGITTNILADRLKKLESSGVINKAPYQERPVRYEYTLTRRGKELFPVIKAMLKWGNRHFPDSYNEADINRLLGRKK